MYDAIVVGARVAGAPTAMLLAQTGHRVLLVDRDTFPSDTLSTHLIRPEGVALLDQWGLLQRVLDTGCPPIHRIESRFMGDAAVEQFAPGFQLCPRRTVLDAILLDAALGAGAEVRQGFTVTELVQDSDGRVTGVVGRNAKDEPVTEEARIVIGADGPHSRLARLLEPEQYEVVEPLVCGWYSYFSGMPMDHSELHLGPGGVAFFFPTNDQQVCVATERPMADFAEARGEIEDAFMAVIQALAPHHYETVRNARREEPFRGAGDLEQYFRKPYGPGWALVGDAGAHVDPTLGLGISKAFTEAVLVSEAVDAALSDRAPFEEALAAYQQQRDTIWLPLAAQNVGASQAAASGRLPLAPV